MKQELRVQQTRKKKTKLRMRDHCPMCGAVDLLTLAPDQFCTQCEWDTCIEYVELGLMDNLEVAAKNHFCREKRKTTPKSIEQPSEEIVEQVQLPKSA